MKKPDLLEAVEIIHRTLDGLADTLQGVQTRAASDLRRAIGDLRASIAEQIIENTVAVSLFYCFRLAILAGATVAAFERLRGQLIAETPKHLLGVSVTQTGVRYTLAQMSRLIAKTEFVSRQDVSAIMELVNDAFNPAEENASDQLDAASYQALIALHAAVINDLVTRAQLLPRVVTYQFPASMPALWIAQRLYQDATRSDQLRLENKWVHPAFPPPQGVCLSA